MDVQTPGKGVTMKILIRMIGIATTLFWIFLIVFFISAVYSAKDIDFDFWSPTSRVKSGQ